MWRFDASILFLSLRFPPVEQARTRPLVSDELERTHKLQGRSYVDLAAYFVGAWNDERVCQQACQLNLNRMMMRIAPTRLHQQQRKPGQHEHRKEAWFRRLLVPVPPDLLRLDSLCSQYRCICLGRSGLLRCNIRSTF